MIKKLLLISLSWLLLTLPPLYWLNRIAAYPPRDPVETLTPYLKFLYAREFRQAYRFISVDDRRLKTASDYVRERGPFSGFTLDVARKLAGLIEIRLLSNHVAGTRATVTASMKLPDANSLAGLLLDWDEAKLNALSASERKIRLAAIDSLIAANKLPMIEGEEKFVLVKEGAKWKVFLDWAAGAQVQFAATVPPGADITAEPLTEQTVARSGDLFTVGFKVSNPSAKKIVARILHRVEPKEVSQYLDLVECALLLPVRIEPGETQTYNSTYIVRGDLPDGTKTVHVTYEFAIENQ